ncbi:Pr6Pr family membrane protein [Pontimonas sp.]|uniref:Pr6Pr family membrane protein n=1 Tax=Pontimonas sp. TaxID=2304492 RepID=UPI00286FDC6F|nr:Pr6Pr family membrane protein [Pontimonas sp.]MDR9396045.1 Pr6Pr family membrane protein [Pontimonas sp.]MDR9434395.1 Pr6Pr family membrane protein [Pontimonas sp.]
MNPSPGPLRHTLGVLALLAATGLAVALFTQISDQIHHGAFVPEEYFSYFSIQTSLANVLALTAYGLYQLQSATDSPGLLGLRHALVAYAVVTGSVYNLLLRDLPPEPGGFVSEIAFPNEVIHVIIPVYLVADWILSPHGLKLPWWSMLWGLFYPLAWLAATLLRGELTGWYPYAFLDPSSGAGWAGVGAHVLGIALFIGALLIAGLILNRLYCRLRSGDQVSHTRTLGAKLAPRL